ncbi:MAG: polysaccharide biosynthesis/export family protein [Acidobacteriota bacterium]
MNKLASATLLLIGSLSLSALGQVKPGIASDISGSTTAAPPHVAKSVGERFGGPSEATTNTSEQIASGELRDPASKKELAQLGTVALRGSATFQGAEVLNTAVENSRPRITSKSASPISSAITAGLTQLYRVGVGDVLDIQLADTSNRDASTLFTVLEGGMLDYPLAGNPIPVVGLTAAEISARLRQQIRIFDNPAVVVSVRDYASHSVTVTGLIAAPGIKMLRREAVPLYVVLAQALVQPEATCANIVRQGVPPVSVDLRDADATSLLLVAGDVIRVTTLSAGAEGFYFSGGEIKSPGQKPYHAGLTITQAILASGGLTVGDNIKIQLSRARADGRLVTTSYNLRQIQNGKVPDPLLHEGDRLHVGSAH